MRLTRVSREIMRKEGWSSFVCYVLYANDEVGLHRFNANGSHRRLS